MSRFEKSHLSVDGDTVHVSMPFAKVNKSKRTVSGWATLDNLDTQGDVVLAEAAAGAFRKARGNIREMHESKAVGRMLEFQEREYYDAHTKELYKGIYVTAYISKGAEDTWEKVLDGTLSGFSIGGDITESDNKFVKAAKRTVRFIKGFNLTELSLVDNPANQLSNVESFTKNILTMRTAADGSVIAKGIVAETVVENVFVCTNHEDPLVNVSDDDTSECLECGGGMTNVGWFESGDNREERVDTLVSKFVDSLKGALGKGGVTVSKNNEETAKEVGVVNPGEEFPDGEKVEDSDETSVPVSEERTENVEEVEGEQDSGEAVESESPEEVTDDAETQISKKIDELQQTVRESLNANHEATLEKVSALEKQIEDASQNWLDEVTDIKKKLEDFDTKFDTQKSKIVSLENALEKFNKSGAMKKSAGATPPAGPVQKESFWGGAFSD